MFLSFVVQLFEYISHVCRLLCSLFVDLILRLIRLSNYAIDSFHLLSASFLCLKLLFGNGSDLNELVIHFLLRGVLFLDLLVRLVNLGENFLQMLFENQIRGHPRQFILYV